MTRYNFYNNLELFHKTKEIIQQEEQEKIQEDLNELTHYGTKGQKWGVRKWQNYDGTFNEAGKERYFGKSSQITATEEDKVGSARSDVKEYLKFRNKMLKQRTRDDLNKWYRDNNKAADKQLLKDAKKVDKQREKMYKNQLKDFYDDPNELVSDLDRIYKIGSGDDKVGGLFNKKATNENSQEYNPKYQKLGLSPKEAKKLAKEAEKLEKELKNANYQDKQKIINDLINDDKYKDTINEAIKPYVEKNKKNIDRVNEIFKDYEDDEINTLANAGIANSLMNKWGDKNNNETMKELAGYTWFYLNDDGNQSDNTAEYLYATIDKGIKAKELGNLWDNLRYSNEEKNENISLLKKDLFLSNLSDDTLKNIVTNKFESKFNKSSYWNLYNASDTASDPDDTVKKAYSEAKNISKKLEKSCGNTNGWDYFWKAIDNLNMGDMNYKDLSQSDWDKINAEINKLKK